MRIWFASLAVLAAITAAQATQATQALDFQAIDAVALQELKDSNTPGAAIAIVRGNRVVHLKGYGAASVETGAPVTPDMFFAEPGRLFSYSNPGFW